MSKDTHRAIAQLMLNQTRLGGLTKQRGTTVALIAQAFLYKYRGAYVITSVQTREDPAEQRVIVFHIGLEPLLLEAFGVPARDISRDFLRYIQACMPAGSYASVAPYVSPKQVLGRLSIGEEYWDED